MDVPFCITKSKTRLAVKQSLVTHPFRLLPQGIHRESPFILREKVKVKWLSHERRKPHINFAYQRYTGDCLIKTIGKSVWIEYDFRDIRKLKVITENGQELGYVLAPKSWQRYAHSVQTRKYIYRYCRLRKLRMKDPLVEYFAIHLKRAFSKPKSAQELLRLKKEFAFNNSNMDSSTQPPNLINADLIVEKKDFCPIEETSTKSESGLKPWSLELADEND